MKHLRVVALVGRDWRVRIKGNEPGNSDCQQTFRLWFIFLLINCPAPSESHQEIKGTSSCPLAHFSAILIVSKCKSRQKKQKSGILAHTQLKAFATCLSSPRAITGDKPLRVHLPKPSDPSRSICACSGHSSWLSSFRVSVLLTRGWRAAREVQAWVGHCGTPLP